jgi:RNA polymerase sigma-70 factor, ECF subfamily
VELTSLLRARKLDEAATLALQAYGPEVFGFLIGLMGSEADAAETFSQVTEDLWRGLPSFGMRCSVRTWLYLIARHAAARFRRSPWNRGGRTGDAALDEQIALVRSRTPAWARTGARDHLRALRSELTPEDQVLLVLRLDRRLSWNEVALVTLGSESPPAGAVQREAARLRKRFQGLKEELRARAVRVGLFEPDR